MNQATTFLGASILMMIGTIVIIVGVVAINNILHKFWKPVNIFTPDSWRGFNPPVRYTPPEDSEPTIDQGKKRGNAN